MGLKITKDCWKEIEDMLKGGWKYRRKKAGVGKGAKNPRWKGGYAEYPNHRLLQKNRLIRFEQAEGLCEICGKKAAHTHHIDFSKDNHDLNNLLVVCHKCHHKLHRGRKNKTVKWLQLYGMNRVRLCKKLNCGDGLLRKLHEKGMIKSLLEKK